MLAPRKTLWSTPRSAIDTIEALTNLLPSDKVYDIGCGDARVLIHLAKNTRCRQFVGIEIDSDRVQEARAAVKNAKLDPDVQIEIRCLNALTCQWDDATVIFMYLIPRGLRRMKPLLIEALDGMRQARKQKESSLRSPQVPTEMNDSSSNIKSLDVPIQSTVPLLRVVTYMTGWSDIQHVAKELCIVEHQKDARWPLYLYHFY